jgi:hypothetical protein
MSFLQVRFGILILQIEGFEDKWVFNALFFGAWRPPYSRGLSRLAESQLRFLDRL